MNNLERATREMREMDDFASLASPVHRLSPLSKLLTTLLYIVIVTSFDKYALTRLIPLALYPVALYQAAGIPLRACFRKLLFNPIFDRAQALTLGSVVVTGGVLSMLTLMLKGVLALTMSFLLIATTSIDSLCAALRRVHVPGTIVTLLLLTYRYAGLLIEEASAMTDAYRMRAPGQRGVRFAAWGSFLGQLLLRSMDRAHALYASMKLRGFHGAFYYAQMDESGWSDVLFYLLSAALLLFLRRFDIARWLGELFLKG